MTKGITLLLAALCCTALLSGCTASPAPAAPVEQSDAAESEEQAAAQPMSVESAGVTGGVLADVYGAKGVDFVSGYIPARSLPLTIKDIPAGTVALAVRMSDPDASDWVHWLAANLPAGDVADNASRAGGDGVAQGVNSFGTIGYGGPTPPSGTHAYVVTVYALSEALPLQDGFSDAEFTAALEGRVLAQAQLTAQYSK
ncbi:MAG: YbhB/YbcL family Raf kinase inhibitor-like protein [Oscillospiraceae bacterium]|nr:YbhB/YbcL family Raf kinase inhibitor-like protein [Oscillospiraceae bacterium]